MIWQQKHLFAAALAGLLMAAPVVLPARQPAAKAALDLGTTYDFCGPANARTILVNIWGNPAAIADGVLGILALAGKFPCALFKPILVTLVAAFAAFRSRITGLFGRKTDDLAGRN